MDRRGEGIILASIAAVVLLWLLSPLAGNRPWDPTLPDAALLFDAQQGFDATREFVTRYPRRVLGTLEARQSTAFFRPRLEPLGYGVTYAHFDATIANHTEVGRNVLAFKQGQTPEILVIMAHYDTARPTVQGAMDDGSGIGVLVELGRVLSAAPLRHSLLLVASDGEEWGMLGAADFAEHYPDRSRIAAVLSLDYLAPGELANLQLAEVGLKQGYCPSWLRDLTRKAVSLERLQVLEPSGLEEHLERALLISLTDQGPLLENGIPAINLGSESVDKALEDRIYHSPEDTIEHLRIASFETYGRAAERTVRALDVDAPLRRDLYSPFRVTAARYLAGPIVAALHLLTFLPLLAAVGFMWRRNRARLKLTQLLRELIILCGILLPMASIYYAIVMMARTGHIPQFSVYPPGPKDPMLQNPSWGIVASLGIVLLLFGTACYFGARSLAGKLRAPGSALSRVLALTAMVAVVALAICYNSYWAVAFLSLPAWVWVLTGEGRTLASRTLNAVLIVLAGLPWYAATVHYSHFPDIGWGMVWFVVLAFSTGLFSPAAYFLAAMMVAIGLRLAALQFVQSGSQGSEAGS
jgi:hypothetical protein